MSAQAAKSSLLLKLAIVAAILVGIGFVVFNRMRPTAVVAVVTRGPAADIVTGSLVVHAQKDRQEIKSEMGGRVAWIDPRQLGEPFKAGEPIVKLDSSDLEREKKEKADAYKSSVDRDAIAKKADVRLQVAKENFEIAKLRHDRGEISDSAWLNEQRAFKQVETNVQIGDFDEKQRKIDFDNAQAALQRQIDKMTIRAPMDGICEAVMVAPGALIGGGTPVATFFSNERVVIAKIGEEDIGRVKVGQLAKVRLLNLPGEQFDAKVTTILPFADADTQRYSVYFEVKADPQKLKPFSTGEVSITVGARDNQPLIPRRALFNDEYVFVVKNGVVQKRKVEVGYKALNKVEVRSALNEGEQVIVEDVDQFRDGQHVQTKLSE